MTFNLRDVRAFLLDMDGTIYLGNHLLPGAAEFLAALQRTGRSHLYLTNNSSSDAATYAHKLGGLGLPTRPEQVMTSGEATVDHLQKVMGVTRALVLGTPSLEQELAAVGIHLTSGHQEPPEAVVLGFDLTLTYEKVRQACHWIRTGVPFVASHPDLVCPTPEGPIPDCGAMSAMITAATGVAPIVIGKPQPAMAQAALRRLGATPETTAMVGDRLYTDMAMGFAAGLHTILVLSGEATREDVAQADRKPSLVVAGVGDLVAGLD